VIEEQTTTASLGGMMASGLTTAARKRRKHGNFIQGAIKHPGSLHRALGVPQGQSIPAGKLAEAARSSDANLRRKAQLAKTLATLSGRK
jgi:hypothetical protein